MTFAFLVTGDFGKHRLSSLKAGPARVPHSHRDRRAIFAPGGGKDTGGTCKKPSMPGSRSEASPLLCQLSEPLASRRLFPAPTNQPPPLSWSSLPSVPPRTQNRTRRRVRGSTKLPSPAETPPPTETKAPPPLLTSTQPCPGRLSPGLVSAGGPASNLSASASSAPWSCGQTAACCPPARFGMAGGPRV